MDRTNNRRAFLRGAAVVAAGGLQGLMAKDSPDWRKQIGLQLYTVRDRMDKDFEGTLAQVAGMGYREVEPTSFGGLKPKAFRALLDRYKLRAPSTHVGVVEGPGLEKELEGHQVIGFQYTQISSATRPKSPEPRTVESIKRSAAEYNRLGGLARKFGMKVFIHNHAHEFDPLGDGGPTQYDILLAETDPARVALELDIAWAVIGGQNILEMFAKHPGRFELWHVKDAVGLKNLDLKALPGKRRAKFVPVGQGEIDYKVLFPHARQVGMRHFYVEQDNAGENGADSLAAARASVEGLKRILA